MVYIYIYIYMHTYTHTCIYLSIYLNSLKPHTHTNTHTHTHTHQDWVVRKQNQQMFAAINSRQVSPNPANTAAAAASGRGGGAHAAAVMINRRQMPETEADPTQLLMHWYNNETRKWTPLTGGSITEGTFVTNVPPLVLRNPGFSGMLANMLVTEVPYTTKTCSEFETLVNGKCVVLSCSYYALLERWDAGCIEDTHCLLGMCVHVCACVLCVCACGSCVYWSLCVCVCLCARACLCVCVYIYIYIYIFIHIYIYIYIHKHIYIYTYIHIHNIACHVFQTHRA
jgi:hypothetical protein